MARYDIAIIGTGPGGISAAITARVRNKNIVLLGSRNLSDKLSRAHRIDNYPGLPQISGADFAQALRDQLAGLGIGITEKRVASVYAMGEYFMIQAGEDILEASSVILASGLAAGKTLPGELPLLGRGVSYCATCDARLYRGKTVAVLGYSDEAAAEAEFLSEIVRQVLFFPLGKTEPQERDNLRILREKPEAIEGETTVRGVRTAGGLCEADGVFVLRDSVAPDRLVPGLELTDGHVAVDLEMRTNLPGLFACGDITGKPYQYIKAAGQGNVAALSAVAWLRELQEKKEK